MSKVPKGIIVLALIFSLHYFFGCMEENYNSQKKVLSGDYPGETSAGDLPTLFSKGFVSTNLSERDVAISPNGKEFYYTLWTGTFGVIMKIKEKDGKWESPEVVPFSHQYSNLEPFITNDGKKLFFSSNRPIKPDAKIKDYDIWFVENSDTGWGNPVNLGSPVNSGGNEFYPSLADNGNIYFTAARSDSYGSEDIYLSEYKNGNYSNPVNLGTTVNSKTDEFNAFIAPDESYLIFSNWGRDDGLGGGDLYISFNNNDEWIPAINLGEKINSSALDYCPFVTRDGKYFFFTSRRTSVNMENQTAEDYKSLVKMLNSPLNGKNDIYWMKAGFIDSLKAIKY